MQRINRQHTRCVQPTDQGHIADMKFFETESLTVELQIDHRFFQITGHTAAARDGTTGVFYSQRGQAGPKIRCMQCHVHMGRSAGQIAVAVSLQDRGTDPD